MMGAITNESSTSGSLPVPLPSSSTTNFHHTTPASITKQPRLRASCDGCFLAKVKCTKARPVCSRCLAVGLVCRYSPSSRSLGSNNKGSAHDKESGGGKSNRKTRARRNGGTAVLASTMSEESCAWLAQQAWQGGSSDNNDGLYGKGGFEWNLGSLSMLDQGYHDATTMGGSEWTMPESQGWIQFGYSTFEGGMNGTDVCWQTMREVNSPFSIGSSTEMDEVAGAEFVGSQGQWVG